MLVIEPSIQFDVSGYLNFNILANFESNRPKAIPNKYTSEY